MSLVDEREILERVIPLPRQARIAGLERVRGERIAITTLAQGRSVETAVETLRGAIPGAGAAGDYVIRLSLTPADAELAALTNAAQAYRIAPTERGHGLELRALTGEGLLNAARTLAQLVRPLDGGEIEIPRATILDWPALAERGEWGGDAAWDLAQTAPLKMNLVEIGFQPEIDDQGRLRLRPLTPLTLAAARAQGVKALPYIPHLGDLGKTTNLFHWRPELMSSPDPRQPLPPDYRPSLCFCKPAAAELLAEAMRLAAGLGAEELNVWLTEEGRPCFCDGCRGENSYVLETRLLVAACRLVQAGRPGFRLRILLTQGSYPYNDLILAELPPDVGATYYSGTHTYDSSHRPMIYPRLEEYARQGGWLGVYPQIDNSWRTVFPFTAPQFIRFRMCEFAAKGLQSVTGYATPANDFWRFNVAAMAEWSWNPQGRDEQQFARAWARRQGIHDVDTFARWACLIGPLGWDLAGSRLPMRLFWDPAQTILAGPTPLAFGEGPLLAEIPSCEHLERNIALAGEALALAQGLGDLASLAESQVLLSSYLLLQALIDLSRVPAVLADLGPQARQHLAERFSALDAAAEGAVRGLWAWGCEVYPQTPEKPPHRFEETMSVYAQVVDEAAGLLTRLGIDDPRPAYRDRPIGRWTAADFPTPEVTLRFAVTPLLAGPGAYRVLFRYTGGAYGVDIRAVTLLAEDGRGVRQVARVEPRAYGYGEEPPLPHVGGYEAWNDVRLDLPTMETGCRYYVQAELTGIPADAPVGRHTSEGEVLLRRAWA